MSKRHEVSEADLKIFLQSSVVFYWLRKGVTKTDAMLLDDRATELCIKATEHGLMLCVYPHSRLYDIALRDMWLMPDAGEMIMNWLKKANVFQTFTLIEGKPEFSHFRFNAPIPGISNVLLERLKHADPMAYARVF